MRLAKIVATLGPACASRGTLRAMVAAGLDVARLNFSHGDVRGHAAAVERLRLVARQLGRPVAVLQDLQGPRIRLGRLPPGGVVLRAGERVDLAPAAAGTGTRSRSSGAVVLPTTYRKLAREVRRGERILLRDGTVELRVLGGRGALVRCEVVRGGAVKTHSGMNVPDARLSAPALTRKDRADLAAGARIGVDAVALSFVRSAADVKEARALLRSLRSQALLVAKIERKEALADLDAILAAADGVMVARGDLGVEVGAEEVPLLQKRIIGHSLRSHTFVITATQMLESMVSNAAPTRAEVSDVANAVLDGSDALMLSAETAAGSHPVEAIATMDRIIRRVEEGTGRALAGGVPMAPPQDDDLLHALAGAAVRLAGQARAKALVPFTVSGRTASVLATWRPDVPILAWTLHEAVRRRLGFWRGVTGFVLRRSRDLAQMFADASRELTRRGRLRRGDVVVFVGGTALTEGSSNTLKLQVLGARDRAQRRRPAGHA
jgi:pyruvate kinase